VNKARKRHSCGARGATLAVVAVEEGVAIEADRQVLDAGRGVVFAGYH